MLSRTSLPLAKSSPGREKAPREAEPLPDEFSPAGGRRIFADYPRRMPRRLAIIAVLVALLSGCGEGEPEVIDVGTRITNASDALECPQDAQAEARSVTAGNRAVKADARAAVQAWAKRMRRSADIPLDGYEVGVEEVGTVLFTHETDGLTGIAVIAARTDDAAGEVGWLVRSWARCR